jgi:hypothetical protein
LSYDHQSLHTHTQQFGVGKKGGTIFFLGLFFVVELLEDKVWLEELLMSAVALDVLIHLSTLSLLVLKRTASTALLISLVLFSLGEDEVMCMWYNHLSWMQVWRGVA